MSLPTNAELSSRQMATREQTRLTIIFSAAGVPLSWDIELATMCRKVRNQNCKLRTRTNSWNARREGGVVQIGLLRWEQHFAQDVKK
mmetsp:Transcript_12723/g.25293  ORF Transcript_12723/g.25293 Transcript_12723/m.25293 type:complete len:87 (+) Transcript_12723:138-398(+)